MAPFVAGRYTSAYNAVDTGISNEGIELQQESRWEEIATSDAFGDSIIDGVFRGGNAYLQFESKAFSAGSVAAFWPWAALGLMQTAAAPIGRLASAVASPTVLTAVTGTAFNTAGAIVVNSLTAPVSILSSNSPARLLFHSRLRQVPVRLLMLPSDAGGGTTKWFTSTLIGFLAVGLTMLASLFA